MAHGVHLGEHDATVSAARSASPLAIIGASYDSVVNAQRAANAGASYCLRCLFPVADQSHAHAELSVRKARALGLPLVAIGGITPDNAPELIAEGAGAIAVASGLLAGGDIEAAARRYAGLFP
jgi:thiamine-phosphate pyrophosphorylase